MRLWNWLRAVAAWLGEMWHVWISLLVFALALFVPSALNWSENAIRVSGLVLQLLGITTVVVGIRQTRAFFGRPSTLVVFKAWLRRFPRFKPQRIGVGVEAGIGLDVSADGYKPAGPIPEALEDRVARLETGLDLVNERIDVTNRTVREHHEAQAQKIDAESRARVSEDGAIRQKLEGAATGGFRISGMGAGFLLVGVTMGTIPGELSKWLG